MLLPWPPCSGRHFRPLEDLLHPGHPFLSLQLLLLCPWLALQPSKGKLCQRFAQVLLPSPARFSSPLLTFAFCWRTPKVVSLILICPESPPPHFQFPFWHLHSCSLGPASSCSPGLETSESEVLGFLLLACSTFHQLSHAVEPHPAASHASHGICPLFSIPIIIPVIQILNTLHVDPGKHLLICLSSLVSSSPPPYTLWLDESLWSMALISWVPCSCIFSGFPLPTKHGHTLQPSIQVFWIGTPLLNLSCPSLTFFQCLCSSFSLLALSIPSQALFICAVVLTLLSDHPFLL